MPRSDQCCLIVNFDKKEETAGRPFKFELRPHIRTIVDKAWNQTFFFEKIVSKVAK